MARPASEGDTTPAEVPAAVGRAPAGRVAPFWPLSPGSASYPGSALLSETLMPSTEKVVGTSANGSAPVIPQSSDHYVNGDADAHGAADVAVTLSRTS